MKFLNNWALYAVAFLFGSVLACTTQKINIPEQKVIQAAQHSAATHMAAATSDNKDALGFLKTALDIISHIPDAAPVKQPVESAQAKVTESNNELLQVNAQVDLMTQQTQQLEDKIAEQASLNTSLSNQLSTVIKEKASAISERDAANKKYQDAWLGGKAWATIWWISGVSIFLVIAGLILNLHTDIFVWPLKIIAWVLTPKS